MSFTYTVKSGDTLNSISNKYGFSNYKKAGISSVPSGNFNLIHPGEKITLNNYDPNAVGTPLAKNPPVISSKDHATQFTTNKNNLDNILSGQKPQDNSTPLPTTPQDTAPANILPTDTTTPTTPTQPNDVSSIGSLYQNSKNAEQLQITQATNQMNAEKTNFLNTINTRLANIDATTKATTERITALAQSRIDEQTRINQINTDRIKAYGLANGGLYEPVQYTSAVTQKETQGALAISKIEQARDSAISQAEIAARQGKSSLLAQKMDTISKFESNLRSNLMNIENESAKQYSMLIQVRKAKQAENIKALQEMQARVTAFVELHSDEYKNLTPEQISQKITQIMTQTNMGYSQAYNAIMAGINSNANSSAPDLKAALTQAEINKTNAQTKTEATKQYKNIQEANKQNVTVKTGSILDKFAQNFVPGKSIPVLVNGKKSLIPVLDSSGNMTPEAWKSAISEATQNGATRDQFLKRFGHFIVAPDGTVSTKFGLTPGELKKIHATERGVAADTGTNTQIAIH